MWQHTDLILLVGRMDAKVNNLFENDKWFKETIAGIGGDLETHKISDRTKQQKTNKKIYQWRWIAGIALIWVMIVWIDNPLLNSVIDKLASIYNKFT